MHMYVHFVAKNGSAICNITINSDSPGILYRAIVSGNDINTDTAIQPPKKNNTPPINPGERFVLNNI